MLRPLDLGLPKELSSGMLDGPQIRLKNSCTTKDSISDTCDKSSRVCLINSLSSWNWKQHGIQFIFLKASIKPASNEVRVRIENTRKPFLFSDSVLKIYRRSLKRLHTKIMVGNSIIDDHLRIWLWRAGIINDDWMTLSDSQP